MMTTALTRRPASTVYASRDPFFSIFDSFFRDGWTGETGDASAATAATAATASWVPAIDIRESDDAFVALAELPGLTKKDIEITLEDKVLTLKGERRFENDENRDSYRRVERRYGSFHRSFTLPTGVDNDKVEASFQNGLLTVTIPKAETTKARSIAIA